MRLIDPGPGEVTDRLTILSLKIRTGTESGLDVSHFVREQTVLLTKIRSRTLNGVWFAQVLDLAAVNALLWQAEDELREWRAKRAPQTPDSSGLSGVGQGYLAATAADVVAVAFRIQELNDQRAQLVQQINKEAGEASGPEKL